MFVNIVLSVCAIVAYVWGYRNYKKARKYKEELQLLKQRYLSKGSPIVED